MKKFWLNGVVLGSYLLLGGFSSASAQTYAIDPGHTFVTWEAKHTGLSTSRGRFEKKEGSISFDLAAKSGKVEIILDMNAMTTGILPFDKNLKGPNFFDAEKHPTAKFVWIGIDALCWPWNPDLLQQFDGALTG